MYIRHKPAQPKPGMLPVKGHPRMCSSAGFTGVKASPLTPLGDIPGGAVKTFNPAEIGILLASLALSGVLGCAPAKPPETGITDQEMSTLNASFPDTGDEPGLEPAPTPDVVKKRLTPVAREAFEKLLSAERFVSADTDIKHAQALQIVMQDKAGDLAIDCLFDYGTPAAKLYALAAYWYWYPVQFQSLRAVLAIKHGDEEVRIGSGPAARTVTLSELLRPRPRATQLPPGGTLQELRCRQEPIILSDFAGGTELVMAVEEEPSATPESCEQAPTPEHLQARPDWNQNPDGE